MHIFSVLAHAGLSTWVCLSFGAMSLQRSVSGLAWPMLSSALSSAAICAHPIKPMLGPNSSTVSVSLCTRCDLQLSDESRGSADIIGSAGKCTSVMLQIDANMFMSYAGRALHMVHRHGIGASGALGECCGPRDASSVPRCYAPFRVSDGRPTELNFACAPTRRVRDW